MCIAIDGKKIRKSGSSKEKATSIEKRTNTKFHYCARLETVESSE